MEVGKMSRKLSNKFENNLTNKDELRKLFQEKRKARFEEIQAKIAAKRFHKNEIDKRLNEPLKNAIKQKSKTANRLAIKQTKTSQLRMEKNNPLNGIDIDTFNEMLKNESTANVLIGRIVPKNGSKVELNDLKNTVSQNESRPRANSFNNPRNAIKSNKTETKTKSFDKPSIRRSITSLHNKKAGPSAKQKCIKKSNLNRSRSDENVSVWSKVKFPSPIAEVNEPVIHPRKTVVFATPKVANYSLRRSMSADAVVDMYGTPAIPLGRTFGTPLTPHRTPAPSELRDRLIKWLHKRGKALTNYEHLRSFGVHQSTPYRRKTTTRAEYFHQLDDENKENLDEILMNTNDCERDPKIIDYTNFTTDEDLFGTPARGLSEEKIGELAKDVLNDLHALILDQYPKDQCEAWLSALKRKYPSLQEYPEYWECRAAFGVANAELHEAVECYQQAIIKGAEVDKVDRCIDHLLEKFSVLNLETTQQKDTKEKKNRSKIILDARNIFKSTVIKFAVNQRDYKTGVNGECSKNVVARPVRRSTRLSRTAYVSTPKIHIVDSLRQIDSPERRCLQFHSNPALPDS